LFDSRGIAGTTIGSYLGRVRAVLTAWFTAPIPAAPLAAMVVRTLKQLRVAPPRFSDPVPAALIARLMADETEDLGVRAALVVMWFTASRVGCVSHARVGEFDPDYVVLRRDVVFADGRVRMFFPTNKTDKFNVGGTLWVLPTGGPGCPVAFLTRYAAATAHWPADTPFFRRARCALGLLVTRLDVAKALRRQGRAMGLPVEFLLTHGVRSGVASLAVTRRLSIADMLLFGNWATEDSALCYMRLTIPRAERITQAISLEEFFPPPGGGVWPPVAPSLLLAHRARRGGERGGY